MNARFIPVILLLIVVLGAAAALVNTTYAEETKPTVVVIALGLFGEDPLLNAMIGNITEVDWKVITEDFTYDDLIGADMVIFVQVDTGYNLTDEMVNAIKQWFNEGGKTLWVTSDSDYSGGDYLRIPPANKILEAIGSNLRADHVEVVDPVHNVGGKDYRPAGYVEPDPELAVLAGGVYNPILMHGPGALAVYYNGEWYPLYKDNELPVDNIYRIVVTSPNASIHEFVEPKPYAYDILNPPVRSFCLMAAEINFDNGNIVILSAEAPFDHYQGMFTAVYHEVPLSGPTFVKNVVLWGVGLLGERLPSIAVEMAQLKSQIKSLEEQVSNLQNRVSSLEDELTQTQNQLNQVTNEKNQCMSDLENANSQISDLQGQVSNLSTMQWVYLGVGLIIGIIIGFLIGKKMK